VTALKIELSPDAVQQIQAIASWWQTNRTSAPHLFRDELSATLETLKTSPMAARAYPQPAIPGLRRLLLQRTRYHVYFTHHENRGLVFIHAVWHATRGRGPRL
jgi:plasmid stabilization system protein ParE